MRYDRVTRNILNCNQRLEMGREGLPYEPACEVMLQRVQETWFMQVDDRFSRLKGKILFQVAGRMARSRIQDDIQRLVEIE